MSYPNIHFSLSLIELYAFIWTCSPYFTVMLCSSSLKKNFFKYCIITLKIKCNTLVIIYWFVVLFPVVKKKSEFFEIWDKTKILEFLCERNMQFLPADQALSFLWQYVGLFCPEYFLRIVLPSTATAWQRSPGLPEDGTPHPPETPELVTLCRKQQEEYQKTEVCYSFWKHRL